MCTIYADVGGWVGLKSQKNADVILEWSLMKDIFDAYLLWPFDKKLIFELKVSKSQKQILKFSFEPKNKQKYFCISALASKTGQIRKI